MKSLTKKCRTIAAGTLAAIVLAALPATTAAAESETQIRSPFHPTMLWATSEELSGERAPNGSIAALVDDDTNRELQDKTFWTTKWKNGQVNFPHMLAMKNNTSMPVCGIQYTARPTVNTVTGAKHVPGSYAVFAFDEDPGNPALQGDQWTQQLTATSFGQGEHIASGGLQAINDPQIISFEPSTKKVFTLAGFRAADPSKKGMSASDIKLVPCPDISDTELKGQGNDIVQDLYIDELPFGNPGEPISFDTAQHTYNATAYYHTNQVSIRVRAPQAQQIVIAGRLADSQGRVAQLPVRNGINGIPVRVTLADGTVSTYAINIHKVSNDFRGNVLLPGTFTINGAGEDAAHAVTDGNLATEHVISPVVPSQDWSQNATGVHIALGGTRYINRITTFAYPDLVPNSNQWAWGSYFSIALKSGNTWNTVVTKASLRQDSEGILYWDLNGYYPAEEIRIWSNALPAKGSATAIHLREMEIWGLPEGQRPQPNAPVEEGNTTYTNFNPNVNNYGVNRAQAMAIRYGVILPAWIPSEGYGRGVFDAREYKLAGGAFPAFYDVPLFNTKLMQDLGKGTPWSILKAPSGGNSMGEHAEPYDFLSDSMRPYQNSLIDVQYGDEGGYSAQEVTKFARWFAWSKQHLPGAMVHSNQALGLGWENGDNMRNYVRTAMPDLVSWDTYYYGAQSGPKPKDIVRSMLSNKLWRTQRQAALEGLTGDGSQPILFGQYLDYNWDANVSESQKSIVPMVGLATGQKWFGLFRMEYNGLDRSSIFNHDGAPTRSFYEFTQIFNDIRGLGAYLTRMNNTYMGYKAGTYQGRSESLNSIDGFKMGSWDSPEAAQANRNFGLKDVQVTNTGTVNNAQPGDVILGYFDTLQGLDKSAVSEVFGETPVAPRALMVVNALTGDTEYPSYYLRTRKDNGSYRETQQSVTLRVEKPYDHAKLMMVNPQTYQAEPVQVGDNGEVVLPNIGGGQARLLFWKQELPAVHELTNTEQDVRVESSENLYGYTLTAERHNEQERTFEQLQGKKYDSFTVRLSNANGNDFAANSPLTLTLPVRADAQVHAVYEVGKDNSLQPVEFSADENQHITVTTTNLGEFVVAYAADETKPDPDQEPSVNPEEKPSSETENNSGTSTQMAESETKETQKTKPQKNTKQAKSLAHTGSAVIGILIVGLLTLASAVAIRKAR